METPPVTLQFATEQDAPTLAACLEPLLQNLELSPGEGA